MRGSALSNAHSLLDWSPVVRLHASVTHGACVQLMLELLLTAVEKGGIIGALTFGVQLTSGSQAFPSSPTWLLHDSGESVRRCYSNIPVLIRASTLCEVYIRPFHVLTPPQTFCTKQCMSILATESHDETSQFPCIPCTLEGPCRKFMHFRSYRTLTILLTVLA